MLLSRLARAAPRGLLARAHAHARSVASPNPLHGLASLGLAERRRLLCSPATAAAEPLPEAPPPTRFAVVELGGTQYKVAADDVICVEKMEVEVGSIIHAERVLLVASASSTIIGSPLVKDARVEATVEEQASSEKVIVFKKRRRKGYQRWKGHRSPLTVLRINQIVVPPELDTALEGS